LEGGRQRTKRIKTKKKLTTLIKRPSWSSRSEAYSGRPCRPQDIPCCVQIAAQDTPRLALGHKLGTLAVTTGNAIKHLPIEQQRNLLCERTRTTNGWRSVSSVFHRSMNPGNGASWKSDALHAQRANVKLDSFSRNVHMGGPFCERNRADDNERMLPRSGTALSLGHFCRLSLVP
jgi:hypothetical protein